MKKNITKYFALGGLGEVGKNMYAIMCNDDIILLDAGSIFPNEISLGIDYIIADISFLKEHEKNLKALFITHGHEDHIGAIPYLVSNVNLPAIYAPKQAKELIEVKLKDHNIKYDGLHTYYSDTVVKLDNFKVEFCTINHSIPDAHAIAVTTQDGLIISTGDYKIDLTPIGPKTDFEKLIEFKKRGVTLLLADSTNALNPGFSTSETVVDSSLNDIFEKNPNRRLIIATFASNIYRLKHIFETCYKFNKKVFLFGRSMENNVKISIEGNYINHSDIICKTEELKKYQPKDIVILCTGTQGEPLAALSRIAKGTHKQIKLLPDDLIIFSSSAIPGNAKAIGRTINNLFLQGVKVITRDDEKIHTSGHANQEELKLLISLLEPKYLAPLHGEYRMLKKHIDLGVQCGIPRENCFILDNGKSLEIEKNHIKLGETINIGELYIDDSKLQDINGAILRDRKVMADDGILVIIANINMKNRELLQKPNITTRGFLFINESESIMRQLDNMVGGILRSGLNDKDMNINDLKNKLINDLNPQIHNLTGRRPVIVPILIDINKKTK